MNLNTGTWYVKWFFWSCRVLDRFCGYSGRESKWLYRGTNLCHFFRTLMWGALFSGLSVLTYAWMFTVAFILPFVLFNISSVGAILLALCVIILAGSILIATVIGCIWGTSKTIEYIGYRLDHTVESEPGFFRLVIVYIISIKQRFCPTVNFIKESTNA